MNLQVILANPRALFKRRGSQPGMQESDFLKQITKVTDLEPKANNCTRVSSPCSLFLQPHRWRTVHEHQCRWTLCRNLLLGVYLQTSRVGMHFEHFSAVSIAASLTVGTNHGAPGQLSSAGVTQVTDHQLQLRWMRSAHCPCWLCSHSSS